MQNLRISRTFPQTFPQRSHICTKRGLFHYRRRVPGCGDEVTLSLRTLDYREARHVAGLLDHVFNRVLRGSGHAADLRAILKEQFALALRADLDRHQPPRAVEGGYDITSSEDQTIRHAPNVAVFEVEATPSVPIVVPAPGPTGPPLSTVLPQFVDRMTTGDSGWRRHTLVQNEGTFRLFLSVCGDLPVNAYRRTQCSEFSDVLRGLPVSYSKDRKWSDKTPREIVRAAKGQDVRRLTEKTVRRHMVTLSGLFEYLRKRGIYEGENPARGHTLPNKIRSDRKRDQWQGDELRKLFASPLFTGNQGPTARSVAGPNLIKDAKYWLPILGLYHGNRLEEFAQLVRGDVREAEGVMYFAINDEGTKQVKNEHSKRRVPVHSQVLRLGFMEYLKAIARKPSDPVFPELTPRGKDLKRGLSFSKWFGTYRERIGLGRRGLDYHSFRHTFTTKLAEVGVSLPVIDALTGHAGHGISASVYTKELSLATLRDAMGKVEYAEVRLSSEL